MGKGVKKRSFLVAGKGLHRLSAKRGREKFPQIARARGTNAGNRFRVALPGVWRRSLVIDMREDSGGKGMGA